MVVLVDTNVIVDVLMKREPFTKDAQDILTKCATGEVKGCLAAHSLPNLFYIMRKEYSQKERREFIRSLCEIFMVSDLNVKKIMSAAENEEFSDFEDCLQEECAVAEYADYIITRNPGDFVTSRVKVITPAEFLSLTE